jgi:hypothetical protein
MSQQMYPDEQVWETFLDRHHLSMQEEDAFLEYVTAPGVTPWQTSADLERLWERYQEQPPKPVLKE